MSIHGVVVVGGGGDMRVEYRFRVQARSREGR